MKRLTPTSSTFLLQLLWLVAFLRHHNDFADGLLVGVKSEPVMLNENNQIRLRALLVRPILDRVDEDDDSENPSARRYVIVLRMRSEKAEKDDDELVLKTTPAAFSRWKDIALDVVLVDTRATQQHKRKSSARSTRDETMRRKFAHALLQLVSMSGEDRANGPPLWVHVYKDVELENKQQLVYSKALWRLRKTVAVALLNDCLAPSRKSVAKRRKMNDTAKAELELVYKRTWFGELDLRRAHLMSAAEDRWMVVGGRLELTPRGGDVLSRVDSTLKLRVALTYRHPGIVVRERTIYKKKKDEKTEKCC